MTRYLKKKRRYKGLQTVRYGSKFKNIINNYEEKTLNILYAKTLAQLPYFHLLSFLFQFYLSSFQRSSFPFFRGRPAAARRQQKKSTRYKYLCRYTASNSAFFSLLLFVISKIRKAEDITIS